MSLLVFVPRLFWRGILLVPLLSLGCEGCLPRSEVAEVETHPEPTCDGQPLVEGEVLAEGTLEDGPIMQEDVTETFVIRNHDCVNSIEVEQRWARQITQVRALFDDTWNPIWMRKVMWVPGEEASSRNERIYEFRNTPATMTEVETGGEVTHRYFRRGQPTRLVGPGRALFAAWIRAADLEVGQSAQEVTLDTRELFEEVDEVAIRRDADRFEESLGRTVRVYTFFGRESVFTDENGVVIGDLAGLRRSEDLAP